MSVEAFEAQLNWLQCEGFRAIKPSELEATTKDDSTKAVCLTFDDGYLGNYVYALPLLKKYNFSAGVFPTIDLIGRPYYMNYAQLSQMASEGIEIGSHCVSHKSLTAMKPANWVYQLRNSKQELENRLCRKIDMVSFPHGSYNKKILKVAFGLGYKQLFTSDIGFYMGGRVVPRCASSDMLPMKDFKLLAHTDYSTVLIPRLLQRAKNMLKKIVGFELYVQIHRYILKIHN
jgi:peptidoglycan/xylan/chitin deacetylase (PgdA/CDA1 family)